MDRNLNKSALKTKTAALFLCLMVGGLAPLFSQDNGPVLDASFNELSWPAFIEKAEQRFGLQFFYLPDSLSDVRLGPVTPGIPLAQYLRENLKDRQVFVTIDEKGRVFLSKGNPIVTTLPHTIYPQIKEEGQPKKTKPEEEESASNYLETASEVRARMLIIGTKKKGLNERTVALNGYVFDQETKEPIPGATIWVEELSTGVAAETDGSYRLRLDKGAYKLRLRDLNHEEKEVNVELLSSGSQDFYLESKSILLEGVLVTSEQFNRVQSTKMGFERLTAKSIKEIPLVLGERDILKVANLLPGIQSVGEGAAGFNVRGSPADQNLFYIDHVPVYNTAHLFGFFSAFNSEAISDFSLSKGNIPAKFGGRLASIFDISAKEGDKKQFKASGGISPITGRVMLEGPLKKDKSSFMAGLRSTYSNWLLGLIKNPDFNNSRIYFGDAMAKASFTLNDKDRFNAFGYYSLDDINFAGTTRFNMENIGTSMDWNHFFNDRNSLNASLAYSRYGLEVDNREVLVDAYRQANQLEHAEARLDFTLRSEDGSHQFSFGTNAILYRIDQGSFLPAVEGSLVQPRDLGRERAVEAGVYLGDEWKASSRITLDWGLRYNWYTYLGPQSVFSYPSDAPKEEDSVLDTLEFGPNKRIATYSAPDFRLGAKYSFSPDWSLKASYNRLHQYIFLLSNTIALAPTDKWKLTDSHIKPMLGDQVSLGVYTFLAQRKLEFSVESYFKKVNNLVEYKDGASLLANEVPEWDVLQGKLTTYGLEFMLKKPEGRLNGWVNYTYSRATVQVNGALEEERINFGNPYPANHEKPHFFNLVANYKFIRRFSLSANVVYSTGRPITYPTTLYYQNGIPLINFTARNEYRIPDYFRADLSVKVEGNLKARKLLHGNWVFSIYNLTGRHNAYNVYFKTTNSGRIQGYKVSIFANPIFSVTYNIKLGSYED
ncbi:MAG: TonB-dependent receptor [Lewinellaceae bacterium]|nr:TonB-dependent receptor [Lewinellaceae bacterium]